MRCCKMGFGIKIKLGLYRARPGYFLDLVNFIDTHMVLLFLLKTMWNRGEYFNLEEKKVL